ncbi:DUF3325 family protein [Joostella sp. CR20]|uniref:DUF3325 family protein n=1 Tax=Joostella sp. CR20 TaxID=2804312 RepID=UPI00313AC5E0
MISFVILLVFFGFYAFYSTSKRAVLNNSKIDLWLQQKYSPLKLTGLLLLIISLGITILVKGFGAGTLLWIVILMTVGSLVVLITPLRTIHFKTLFVLFIFSVLVELFII